MVSNDIKFIDPVASSCKKQQIFDGEQASSGTEGEKCDESHSGHQWEWGKRLPHLQIKTLRQFLRGSSTLLLLISKEVTIATESQSTS